MKTHLEYQTILPAKRLILSLVSSFALASKPSAEWLKHEEHSQAAVDQDNEAREGTEGGRGGRSGDRPLA